MGKKRSRPQQPKTVTYFDKNNITNIEDNNTPRMKKTWSKHDLRTIKPKSTKQQTFFESWFHRKNVCAHGSAGTGKSFISVYLALGDLLQKDSPYDKIIIVRSAVSSRDMGFLPGTYEEKIMYYEAPYRDIFSDLMGRRNTYDDMKKAGKVEFMTTSFVRGLTWDNAIIIIDEFQNMTWMEMDSVITRVGTNSRVLICGDDKYQCDLKRGEKTCAQDLLKIIGAIDGFDLVEFDHEDIVRGEFVKQWIVNREKLNI